MATGATGRPVHELGPGRDAFGIVAPEAAQGASFEKDGRPDARTVMDRVAFDVEDPTRHGLCAFAKFAALTIHLILL
jgi:hypothetical protein